MPARKSRAKTAAEEPEMHEEELHAGRKEHPECFCMGMGPQISAAVKMGSETTRQHFRTARIEFLKGLRNLLDERIEALSKEAPSQRGAKITVD